MAEQQPYCNGLFMVEVRDRDDIRVHLASDSRIWAAGRSIYEAVGDLVIHHPEHFAARGDLAAEVERLTDELAQSKANESVLVIVGEQLSRHLEWMIEEPNSGLVDEVLDVLKAKSKEDVEHWLNTLKVFGFKRPDQKGE